MQNLRVLNQKLLYSLKFQEARGGNMEEKTRAHLCRMMTSFGAYFHDVASTPARAIGIARTGHSVPKGSIARSRKSRRVSGRALCTRARKERTAVFTEDRNTPLRREHNAVPTPTSAMEIARTGHSVRYATRCHRAEPRVSPRVWARDVRARG